MDWMLPGSPYVPQSADHPHKPGSHQQTHCLLSDFQMFCWHFPGIHSNLSKAFETCWNQLRLPLILLVQDNRSLSVFTFLESSQNWFKSTSEKQSPRPEKWIKFSPVNCSWTLGICPHPFKRLLVSGWSSSRWKFNSPRFFQPQHGRHSCLWISQTSWLVYCSDSIINLCLYFYLLCFYDQT